MKLAVIDYKMGMECGAFLNYLDKIEGIEFAWEGNLGDFEKKHGGLDNYDFLLLHPGRAMQNYYLTKIPEKYPNLEFGFVTSNVNAYCESDIPMFDYLKPKAIVDFLLKKKK